MPTSKSGTDGPTQTHDSKIDDTEASAAETPAKLWSPIIKC
jgi:hypothetical protein